MPQAGDCLVVQIYVRYFDISRQRSSINRKTMVVRGDLDLAGLEIFDRLI